MKISVEMADYIFVAEIQKNLDKARHTFVHRAVLQHNIFSYNNTLQLHIMFPFSILLNFHLSFLDVHAFVIFNIIGFIEAKEGD